MIDLFENITLRDKEKIFKLLEANTFAYKKGTVILSNIKNESILAIIEEGSIQIVRNDYDGNRIIIDDLKKNQILGSVIFPIADENYEVVAKEDTKLIMIDYNRITDSDVTKCTFYNQFIKNLLRLISEVVYERNERIEILTQKSIRDKLLEYFKIQTKKAGFKTFTMPMTFTELADYLAVDRSAMSRELSNLKDEGFVKVSKRKVTLLY